MMPGCLNNITRELKSGNTFITICAASFGGGMENYMKILAVTACPSGVAHTYMSAEAIIKKCRDRGWEVKVETQGSIGIENAITAADIKDASAVILTKDMPIKNEERFQGKLIARVGISDAIKKTDAILNKIELMVKKQ